MSNWKNKLIISIVFILLIGCEFSLNTRAENQVFIDTEGKTLYFDSRTEIINATYSESGLLMNASIQNALWVNTTTQEQFRVNAKVEDGKIIQIIRTSDNPTISVDEIKSSIDNFVKEHVWTVVSTIIILFAVVYRAILNTMTQPYTRVTNHESGLKISLGKYISSQALAESDGKLYVHKFKASKGIKKIYSKWDWGMYSFSKWMDISKVMVYYPFLVLMKDLEVKKIKEDLHIYDFQVEKFWGNYVLFAIYQFFNVLGFTSLTDRLYELMRKEKVELQKIDYLVPMVSLEMLEDRYNTTFERKQINTETGKDEWKSLNQTNLTYSELQNLELEAHQPDSKVRNLLSNKIEHKRRYTSLPEAIRNQRSRIQERAEMEFEIMYYQKISEDNYKLYRHTLEELEVRKMTEQQRMNSMISPILQQNEKRTISLPIALANFVKYRGSGMSIDKSIEKSIGDTLKEVYMDSEERMKYIQENSELKAQIYSLQTIFKDRLAEIDANQFTFRKEQPQPEKEVKHTDDE